MKRIHLSVAWPMIVLAGSLVFAQFRSGNAGPDVSHFRLKIRGYDPKDLLRGRYLLFAVEWNFGSSSPDAGNDKYLCLKKDPSSSHPIVEWTSDRQQPGCEAFASRDSVRQLNRYYLPETAAPTVEKIFGQPDRLFEIEVNVTKDSQITPKSLLIDGVSWETAVENQRTLDE